MGSLSTSILLLFSLSLCVFVCVSSQKIGSSYSLVSIEENPDGGLIGYLKLKQSSKVYGPDIPHLRLFIK